MGNRNIKLLIFLLFTNCYFFTACELEKTAKNNKQSDDRINELLIDYYQTMSDRHWKSYKEFFINDATLTTIWKEETDSMPKIFTNSITDFIKKTNEGPDSQPVFEEKMLNSEIDVNKNLALAWVSYEAKFGTKDNLMKWNGVDLFSFIRYNNEWKIVSIVFESE